MSTPVTRVAIVGTGVIGASWATAFLAGGMDVVASDPAPGAEDALRRTVEWPVMAQVGLSGELKGAPSVHCLAGGCGRRRRLRAGKRPRTSRRQARTVPPARPGGATRYPLCDKRVDDHDQRVPGCLHPPSGARRAWSSVQSPASHSARRSGWRQADVAGRDRARAELLSCDGQAPDPSASRNHGPCGEPARRRSGRRRSRTW